MERYYSVLTFINIFALCIVQTSVRYSNTLSKSKKKSFYFLFNIIIIAALCEWGATMLEGTGPSTRFFHAIVKCTELSIAPYIAFLFVFIVEKRKQKFIYSVLTFNVLLEILSAFTGFIYKVDSNSCYMHASFYWIYILVYTFSILYSVYYMAKTVQKYQFNGFRFFVYMALLMLLGISIQLLNSDFKVDYLVMGIVSIMLYVFILELINQTDQITELLNRRAYENYIQHLKMDSIILFFDVDDFKEINDTYGHSYGDICLRRIAAEIKDIYQTDGLCFRYGGDEFCVILPNSLQKAKSLNHSFLKKMNSLQKAESLPNVSLGYALYEVKKDNLQHAIQEADLMMYKAKEKKRKSST